MEVMPITVYIDEKTLDFLDKANRRDLIPRAVYYVLFQSTFHDVVCNSDKLYHNDVPIEIEIDWDAAEYWLKSPPVVRIWLSHEVSGVARSMLWDLI